jgi:hypothetical protein
MNARLAHNTLKQVDIPVDMNLPDEAFCAHSYIRYVILIANWKSGGETRGV